MFFLALLYGIHLLSFSNADLVPYDCLLEGGNFTCTQTIVQCTDEEGCLYQCYEDTCHTVVFDCSKYPCLVECSDHACVDMAMVCNPYEAETDICSINCLGENSCRFVDFELGAGNIEVDCTGEGSCRNISLSCETENSCSVNCANSACEHASVNCGSQHDSCGLTCKDKSACDNAKLFCTTGTNCNLHCDGDDTCSSVIQSCVNTTLCGCTGSTCDDIIIVIPEPEPETKPATETSTITKKRTHWGYVALFACLGFIIGIGFILAILWFRRKKPLQRFRNISSNSSHPQNEGIIAHIKNSKDTANQNEDYQTPGYQAKGIVPIPNEET